MNISHSIKSLLVAVATVISVTACYNETNQVPAVRPPGVVQGFVYGGVTNANVNIYEYSNGTRGILLGSGVTDMNGNYSITITEKGMPFIVEVTNGTYIEPATSQTISMSSSDSFFALGNYVTGSTITANVSYMTSIAAGLADYNIAQGSGVSTSIDDSATLISSYFGISDIRTVSALDITNPANAVSTFDESVEAGINAAAVSAMMNYLSTGSNTLDFVKLSYNDIVVDGFLNGVSLLAGGGSGAQSVGTTAVDVNFYGYLLPSYSIIAFRADYNKTTVPLSDVWASADAFNLQSTSLYNGSVPNVLDHQAPVVTSPHLDGQYFNNVFDYQLFTTDSFGLESLEYTFNGVQIPPTIGDFGSSYASVVTIDASSMSAGVYALSVVATDRLGNASTTQFNVGVDNINPLVTVTSSPNSGGSTTYAMTGTYTENESGINSILVNGTPATINPDGTWNIDLILYSDITIVDIEVSDFAGNLTSLSFTILNDSVAPQLTVSSSNAEIRVNGTTTQTVLLLDSFAMTEPLLIYSDKTSLGTTAVTETSLTSNGYSYFIYDVVDPFNSGVYSTPDKLTVEVRHLINGVLAQDWAVISAAADSVDKSHYLIPLTTEFLSPTWFEVLETDAHTIEVRVTDEAGNSVVDTRQFKASIVPPKATVTVVDVSPSSLITDFSGRGQLVTQPSPIVKHSFVNLSGHDLFIKVAEPTGKTTPTFDQAVEMGITTDYSQDTVTYYSDIEPHSTYTLNLTFDQSDGTVAGTNPYWCGLEHHITTAVYADWLFGVWVATCEPGAIYNEASSVDVLAPVQVAPGDTFTPYTYTTPKTYSLYTNHQNYRKWEVHNVAHASGYPSNALSVTDMSTITPSSSIAVYANGNELFASSGWYLIPKDATVEIQLLSDVSNPGIRINNDTDVALPDFYSTTTINYDLSYSWLHGRTIEITQATAWDLLSADSVQPVSQFSGVGDATVTLSR